MKKKISTEKSIGDTPRLFHKRELIMKENNNR